jgi:uncharacterized protein
MKTYCLLLLAFMTGYCAHAQKPIDSRELIEKGIKLHDEEKYRQAIQLYQQVHRNDTNYTWALYEIALTQMRDSSFNEALKTCDLSLQQQFNTYRLSVMVLKGSILDDMGDHTGAIRVYDSALVKYPYSENLQLNKAISLMRQDKISEAEVILKQLLVRNPYYSSAHFKLAQCALFRGKIVPATMSLFTYLVNKPGGMYFNNAIKLLNSISNGTDDVIEYASKKNDEEYSFAQLEKIMLSKIALDKNYKLSIDLDDPITRQVQVMLEKLRFDANDNDFWMQFYVPTLKSMFDRRQFEPIMFLALSNVDLPKIQQYVKRNTKSITEAAKVFLQDMDRIKQTRVLDFNKRQSAPELYHFDDGVLIGKGTLANGKVTGPWEFYHPNGNLKSKGEYGQPAKKSGKWFFYTDEGALSGTEQWENGEQHGEDVTYNKWGVVITRLMFNRGKIHGLRENFYAVGQLSTRETFKDGKLEGPYTQLYSTGVKKVEANYSNDELHGPYKSYYQNGQLQNEYSLEKGKVHGLYKSYHSNGQLDFKANYVAGELEGDVIFYRENGAVLRKRNFKKGLLEGEEVEYDLDGKVETKISYRNGKAEGLAEYFHNDKLYSTFLFDNDKLKEAHYFNKKGVEIGASFRKSRAIDLTVYNAYGVRTSEVNYTDKGVVLNNQVYYYSNGNRKEVEPYVDGKLEGTNVYYFPNGAKKYEVNYSKGEKNGSYREYYMNGQLKSEGWYSDNELNGFWNEYNEKGNIETKTFYLNDEVHGLRQFFMVNGKLDYEEVYHNGWVQSYRQFDTTGKVISEAVFPLSTGTYKGVYFNGKPHYEGYFEKGALHGKYTMYFIDGSVMLTRNYQRGLLHGTYVHNFPGGRIATQGNYVMGEKDGVWNYFTEEGTRYRTETYKNGELEGKVVYYHPNGKVERETEFKLGLNHGTHVRYSEDGELCGITYYHEDRIVGYSYNGKDGKLVPVIPISSNTGKIVQYFSNGNKSLEAEYLDGMRTGVYKIYHPNGTLYYESTEKYDLTEGKVAEYSPTGVVRKNYMYVAGNQDGSYKEMHDNGKIKEEGFYFNGYPHGLRTVYDLAGKPVQKLVFYYGLILNVLK